MEQICKYLCTFSEGNMFTKDTFQWATIKPWSTSVNRQANINETTHSVAHAICPYPVLLTQIYDLNLQNT